MREMDPTVCPIVAGAIAGEITSVIYLRFVLANRIYVEAQRVLLCGKSKNSHFHYFNNLKQARIKMTLRITLTPNDMIVSGCNKLQVH